MKKQIHKFLIATALLSTNIILPVGVDIKLREIIDTTTISSLGEYDALRVALGAGCAGLALGCATTGCIAYFALRPKKVFGAPLNEEKTQIKTGYESANLNSANFATGLARIIIVQPEEKKMLKFTTANLACTTLSNIDIQNQTTNQPVPIVPVPLLEFPNPSIESQTDALKVNEYSEIVLQCVGLALTRWSEKGRLGAIAAEGLAHHDDNYFARRVVGEFNGEKAEKTSGMLESETAGILPVVQTLVNEGKITSERIISLVPKKSPRKSPRSRSGSPCRSRSNSQTNKEWQ